MYCIMSCHVVHVLCRVVYCAMLYISVVSYRTVLFSSTVRITNMFSPNLFQIHNKTEIRRSNVVSLKEFVYTGFKPVCVLHC